MNLRRRRRGGERSAAPPATKVFVFTGRFVPGSKAGGPIRSLDALTCVDEDSVEFFVITSDRDAGDDRPYPGVERGEWVDQGSRRVWYAPSRSPLALALLALSIRRHQPSVYYLNSLWSVRYTALPLIAVALRIIPPRSIVLAPRGETLEGAMRSKSRKKRAAMPLYRFLVQSLNAQLHATSEEEETSLRRLFPKNRSFLLPDLFKPNADPDFTPSLQALPLRVAYVSRIHPHKNLAGALHALQMSGIQAQVRVIGEPEDAEYYQKCQRIVRDFSDGLSVEFVGHLAHEQVENEFRNSHVFVLPTRSENFGHVIREGISVGCIPIISDATPWGALVRGVGLDTPDWTDTAAFAQIVATIAALGTDGIHELRIAVQSAYKEWEASQLLMRERMVRQLVGASDRQIDRPS